MHYLLVKRGRHPICFFLFGRGGERLLYLMIVIFNGLHPPSSPLCKSHIFFGSLFFNDLLFLVVGDRGWALQDRFDFISALCLCIISIQISVHLKMLPSTSLCNVSRSSPRAAVAAAASSPHRSTLNNSARNNNNAPEEEYDDDDNDSDEWQDNDSEQLYSRQIFLGKSNDNGSNNSYDDSNNDDNHQRKQRYSRRGRYKSNTLNSGGTAAAAASVLGSTPILNGPIPGSRDDPATMSKTNELTVRFEHDNDNKNDNGDMNKNNSDLLLSQFTHLLRTQHNPPLDMVEMDGDGNCLFRAISLQVYGDPTMHHEVRRHCLDFMEREADHYRNFVADEEFDAYIVRKRTDGVHGNHTEIQAMSELYNRSIEVFVPNHGIEPINIFHSEYKSDDAPIRLCYMDGNHYNAVIDPLLPTAGLGLGLPGLQPGLADKLQLEQAKKVSDESAMEETMRLALEESNRASEMREAIEMKEALRKSNELAGDHDDMMYEKKKALYLSEIEAADFDLEQAVSLL